MDKAHWLDGVEKIQVSFLKASLKDSCEGNDGHKIEQQLPLNLLYDTLFQIPQPVDLRIVLVDKNVENEVDPEKDRSYLVKQKELILLLLRQLIQEGSVVSVAEGGQEA